MSSYVHANVTKTIEKMVMYDLFGARGGGGGGHNLGHNNVKIVCRCSQFSAHLNQPVPTL